MKSKRIICTFIISAVMLAGCGKTDAQPSQPMAAPETVTQYEETDFTVLPDEGFYFQDTLNVTALERNLEGNPAMYCMEGGVDDTGEPYAQVLEYSLVQEGEWEMKVIGQNSLAKRVKRAEKVGNVDIFIMPFIVRGDDGNLYALLQTGQQQDSGGTNYEYSVLQLEEETDSFYEVPLRMASDTDGGTDYSKEDVIKFHVMEDGTPMLVFRSGAMIQFDPDSGAQTAVYSTVPDNALEKNVGYGEREFIYYSATAKMLGILDMDTMTVAGHFGEEIDEEYRGREWCFDTNTEEWQMYAFNTSGIYRVSESVSQASATRLSGEGNFDGLTGATIYDVQVDSAQNVYLLIRRESEDSSDYMRQWEFGVITYSPAEEK